MTAGTATHSPPSGGTVTISTSVASPYVYATIPIGITVTGLHYIDVLGTFNNSDKSSVRIPVWIVYPSALARTGMAELITELRTLTDADINDYSIAGQTYWTDKQLQDILELHRTDLKYVEMEAQEEGDGSYLDYAIGYGWLEQTTGVTAIFKVQDVNGTNIATSEYSVDYRRLEPAAIVTHVISK